MVREVLRSEGDEQTRQKARVEGREGAITGRIGGWGQSRICHCKMSEEEQFWVIIKTRVWPWE